LHPATFAMMQEQQMAILRSLFSTNSAETSEINSHTMWKNEIFSLTEKKSRQINYLVISLVTPLLSRNF